MIGFRGASRYISDDFRDCFELECRAMKKVCEKLGLTNVWPVERGISSVSLTSDSLLETWIFLAKNCAN